MNRLDRVRRVVSVVLVAALLVAVPAIASAVFTNKVTATAEVRTASLVAPTALSGTYQCGLGLFTESLTVTITGFNDAGQVPGATYDYSLSKDGSTRAGDSATSPAGVRQARLDVSQGIDLGATDYTLEVTARYKGWTKTLTRDIRCGAFETQQRSL